MNIVSCTQACSEFMSAAAASSTRMNRALQHERDQKMRLQEVVEQLARQHDNLEKTVTARSTPHTGWYLFNNSNSCKLLAMEYGGYIFISQPG